MNKVTADWCGIEEPAWLENATHFALAALGQMGKEEWVVSLLFCDDEFIQGLNRGYRNKDEPTDVLSFPMGDSISEEGRTVFIAGDIVISIPALARNATDFGVARDDELKRLIVHGLLHLSGMDHENNHPQQPMLTLQESILGRLSGERIQ
ncbi:MAG: rRNA maturation RNase YbeY [Spirochaetaceae bacterium]|nr:rRNA maturation RNase YbeY [Spirochaetaceae bacterium]